MVGVGAERFIAVSIGGQVLDGAVSERTATAHTLVLPVWLDEVSARLERVFRTAPGLANLHWCERPECHPEGGATKWRPA